jgi:hypothetical protein
LNLRPLRPERTGPAPLQNDFNDLTLLDLTELTTKTAGLTRLRAFCVQNAVAMPARPAKATAVVASLCASPLAAAAASPSSRHDRLAGASAVLLARGP